MSDIVLRKGRLSSALLSRFRDYYLNMPGVDRLIRMADGGNGKKARTLSRISPEVKARLRAGSCTTRL